MTESDKTREQLTSVVDIDLDHFFDEDSSQQELQSGHSPREYDRSDRYSFNPPTPDTREKTCLNVPGSTIDPQLSAYYLNAQLVDGLTSYGEIPIEPIETKIGVGFIDIVNYSYLSKWLSPKENQFLLNGLYSAFYSVLKRRGGFLNKISGDSLMFHYGGPIDASIRGLDQDQASAYIAKQLFYTCVDMQRACYLFNFADEEFINQYDDEEAAEALRKAFFIIRSLRDNLVLVSSINVMFQVRIRIGASMGDVSIGNFGPSGAKQWDAIGEPVIEARRMETSAPIDGVRISKELFSVLESTGVAEEYYNHFRSKAGERNGYYQDISRDELFQFKNVVLKDKGKVCFDSYSIQANHYLPELAADQVRSYLEKDEGGADQIIELLQYYRGNRLVMQSIEDTFIERNVILRKAYILRNIFPKKYNGYLSKFDGNVEMTHDYIQKTYSLHSLFVKLGRYQDRIENRLYKEEQFRDFEDYDSYMEQCRKDISSSYMQTRKYRSQKIFFYEIVFPSVFTSIKSSILEYQRKMLYRGQ